MLLLFFMGAALLKRSVDSPLTTSNRNQLVLVVATEGICHRIKEHVLDARRGNATSSPRHLCHSLALLLTMDCFFFPCLFTSIYCLSARRNVTVTQRAAPIISTKDVLFVPGVFQYRLSEKRTQLARSYQLQWLVTPRLPTQTHVPDPTLVLDQT